MGTRVIGQQRGVAREVRFVSDNVERRLRDGFLLQPGIQILAVLTQPTELLFETLESYRAVMPPPAACPAPPSGTALCKTQLRYQRCRRL